jgi:hypothetical protein
VKSEDEGNDVRAGRGEGGEAESRRAEESKDRGGRGRKEGGRDIGEVLRGASTCGELFEISIWSTWLEEGNKMTYRLLAISTAKNQKEKCWQGVSEGNRNKQKFFREFKIPFSRFVFSSVKATSS